MPVPEPGPDDVLIRITVAGINPVDWKVRDEYGHALPFVLGQDFAGVVVGAGSRVKRYAQDDRVFGIAREHGAHAEYTLVPEDGRGQPMAHIPDGVGDADAAGLPTAGLTALACIERTNLKAGDRLAIVGVTGAVGQFATQLAKAREARGGRTPPAPTEAMEEAQKKAYPEVQPIFVDLEALQAYQLALRIATALCAKSGLTIPAETSVETFLEAVAHQFRELGRMS